MAVAALCGAAAMIVQSLTVMVVCVVGAVCSLILAVVTLFAPDRVGASATARARANSVHPAGKRAPQVSAGQGSGAGRPCGCRAGARCPGAAKCRCTRCVGRRRAVKPSGVDHRTWLVGPEPKRIERRVVREHRRGGRR